MPARINVDQSLVSARLVEHLRAALDLTANRCYETIDPLGIQAAPGGDYWVTVAPSDGQFDESLQEGGGADQLVEEAGFTITAYVRVALDETGHDGRLLHDPNRGLLTVKKKLLAALADVDLMTEAGDTFLRSTIKISSASKPEVLQENRSGGAYLGVLQIQCRLEFDWDLS